MCVLKKNTSYYGGKNYPQNFMLPLFYKLYEGFTRVQVKARLDYGSVWDNESALLTKYRLKFDIRNEMYRNTTHYLVAVDQPGSAKPNLYHPAAHTALKVVK